MSLDELQTRWRLELALCVLAELPIRVVLVTVQLVVHGWAVLLTGRGFPSTASAVGAISARSPCLRHCLLAVHKLANRAKHAAFGAGPSSLLSLRRPQRKRNKGRMEEMVPRERLVISRQVQYVIIVVTKRHEEGFYFDAREQSPPEEEELAKDLGQPAATEQSLQQLDAVL